MDGGNITTIIFVIIMIEFSISWGFLVNGTFTINPLMMDNSIHVYSLGVYLIHFLMITNFGRCYFRLGLEIIALGTFREFRGA